MTASPIRETVPSCYGLSGRMSVILAAITLLVLGGTFLSSPGTVVRSQNTPADSGSAAQDSTATNQRVIVYYFHTTHRCTSCRNIEKYTHEAIESGFPTDLEDGDLVWRVVNVEEKGNEHFVKDYQLFTKSVVLVDERTGEWKNLPKVWQLLADPNEFIRYIKTETGAFLERKHS